MHPKQLLCAAGLLLSIAITASAAPAGILRGVYQGNCGIQSSTGDLRYYSPVRITVKKNGTITGTAFLSSTQQLLRVTGKMKSVKIMFKTLYQGKAVGKFSDGTSWKAEFTASKTTSSRGATGTAKLGDYQGQIALTGQ